MILRYNSIPLHSTQLPVLRFGALYMYISDFALKTIIGDFNANYRTRAIITRGLYTFYSLFEVHLCTVTFGLMYG